MYPYATQAAPGEWAFQGALAYNFKRKTAIGGKYGTKFNLNMSYIRGLVHNPAKLSTARSTAPTAARLRSSKWEVFIIKT